MIKTVIAGPCSVESREQLRQVTAALAAMPQVKLIRAGVWKPRTRPGGFEGLGEPALQWMQELAQEFGVQYCCEVAKPKHVELCIRYGIGTVWIGARTSGNPFMVEEICQALRGSDMQVMVKNPTSPDVRLWLGAIERLRQCGIADISAVHRGFDMYHNLGYRNAPLWEVPMTLRREMPEVPLLCDPSHIGGNRELVAPLVQTAAQFDFDGLMVEVHPDPDAALDPWDVERNGAPHRPEGCIIDGFPRTVSQAQTLEFLFGRLKRKIDCVVAIDVPRDELVRRIHERAAISGRADDTEEVIRHRLDLYDQQTTPVLEYYSVSGLLATVDGSGEISETIGRICKTLELVMHLKAKH